MPAIRFLTIGVLAFMLSGCGQLVSEKLTVSNAAPSGKCSTGIKMVVMPFADYSYVDDAVTAQRRHRAIMESLTDQLVSRGFHLPVQEDLMRYLGDNKIIKMAETGSGERSQGAGSVQGAINSGSWSPLMQSELTRMIQEGAKNQDRQTQTIALNQTELGKIANDFNADYIMRGRINKFQLEQENTWRPLKKGIIPVLFGGTSRLMFGVAKSENYDMLDTVALGAAAGAAGGNNANTPYTTADKLDPSGANSVTWAIAGAGMGYLASQGGKTNKATVQLRVWLQDARTGEVIWTNRIEVNVVPRTVFADSEPDHLFDTAVNQAVSSLVNDLVSKTGETL